MFVGQSSHSLDDKGRLIIPAKFREALGRSFYLVIGYDPCLYAYDEAEFEKFAESIADIDEGPAENRDDRRYLLASAADCELDKSGRVLIPDWLREAVGIRPGHDCIIAGVGRKLEIWDKDVWNEKFGKERILRIREKLYDRKTGSFAPAAGTGAADRNGTPD